jgi:hypothetical protein
MKRIFWHITLAMIFFSINSYGQTKGVKFCQEDLLGKSFVSDGQGHQVLLKKGKTSKFFVVFYPQFRYKLVICSNNNELPIEVRIADRNGKEYYTNVDKKYTREWEFQYSSIMNATVELKPAEVCKEDENIKLLIGYQLIQNPKPN